MILPVCGQKKPRSKNGKELVGGNGSEVGAPNYPPRIQCDGIPFARVEMDFKGKVNDGVARRFLHEYRLGSWAEVEGNSALRGTRSDPIIHAQPKHQAEVGRTARSRAEMILAERGGFEPPVEVYPLRRFSKPLPSATRPPLRVEKTGRAESSRRGARACPAGETGLGARRAGYSGGAGGHRAGGAPVPRTGGDARPCADLVAGRPPRD